MTKSKSDDDWPLPYSQASTSGCLAEQIMETLAARYRLGENWWTFDNFHNCRRVLNDLQAVGWIWWRYGPAGKPIASLTLEGLTRSISSTYTPSNPERDLDLRERVRTVAAELSALGHSHASVKVLAALKETS